MVLRVLVLDIWIYEAQVDEDSMRYVFILLEVRGCGVRLC